MKQTIKNFLIKRRFKVLKNKRGFSLMELLIVVSIMGIISTVAIPSYQKYKTTANEKGAKAEAMTVFRALQTCMANSKTPATTCKTATIDGTLSKTCKYQAANMAKATQQGSTDDCYLFLKGDKACALSNIGGKYYCIDNSGGSGDNKFCDHSTGKEGTCQT